MKFYTKTVKDVVDDLKSDLVSGLTNQEAQKRLQDFGENKLQEKKKKSLFMKFLAQFKDVMVIILIIAALISLSIAIYERIRHNASLNEFIEPAVIFAIIILNAILGVFQENKAEKALEALKKMSAPKVKVLRDGKNEIIDTNLLVPGDVIVLEAGDIVPSDCRLVESSLLKCDESSLTGESLPAEKNYLAEAEENAGVGDRKNMVFSGCYVNYGRGKAIVTGTGMDTEIGKIANLLNNEKEMMTPLQKRLASLGKYLGIAALAICFVIFVIGISVGTEPIQHRILKTFMLAVSLAVAAIPEGLPTIVTLTLAIGVQRMVKRNAIIRKLPAVETLGSASVICSDKTGTLTQNKMSVVECFVDEKIYETKDLPSNENSVIELIKYGILCTDGTIEFKDGKELSIGDPTETSIVSLGYKLGIDKKDITEKNKRLADIPFDSDRKLMSVICNINDKNVVIVKGAFDVLIDRCDEGDIEGAMFANEEMANKALRVLAVAIKEIDKIPDKLDSSDIENNLKLVGLLGMIDPPREEAKEAVALCIKAGIKPVMITGDHVTTAKAIAIQLGIYVDGDRAITGKELQDMSDEELKDSVRHISVYARVSPEDKIRIVKAWQSQGEIVAMTGDGVNDAPALKAADIGCAMGITGTEVAKSASDMTLMDDNFATIVHAVKEGRGIYDNIKKSVKFLLSCNIGEILSVFLAVIIWRESPFLAMQLLWINLLTDSFPALALGVERPDEDIMLRKPRPSKESIFSGGMGVNVVLHGIYFGAITLIAYYLGITYANVDSSLSHNAGQTMAFIVLATSQLFQAFNERSKFSLFKVHIFTNPAAVLAFLVSFIFILMAIFIPSFRLMLGLIKLPNKWIGISLAISFSPIVLVEIEKFIKNNIISRFKDKAEMKK